MPGPTLSSGLNLIHKQLTYHPPQPTSSFEGQTVIVTGGNAGLGREASRHMAQLNAQRLIIACRTVSKGEEAKKWILEQTSSRTNIEVWQLNMSDYGSVKAFAQRAKGLERLDAVLENAGSWPTRFEMLEGHEATITVNVISTCLLAYLLLPKLEETGRKHGITTRLSIVSSDLHKFATLKARAAKNIFEELKVEATDYDGRYNDTKLLVVMFIRKLAAAISKQHAGNDQVSLNAMSPGWCDSALKPPKTFGERTAQRLLQRSTDEGARLLVDAVAADKVAGRNGQYISEGQVRQAAAWLYCREGQTTEDKVWTELNAILESIEPGCTHWAEGEERKW
ncbi:hypothetical protein LTR78_009027 [Recurvomyces mirabilis]|uniref:NAD(P)-binding protein n=1 Tax=Recurvomyces mirabilis TaxID=574656 RepID=A0AAE0TSD6_9PEZI|nr:hypothetical protein LTR78_009027 [Recurvomyces mirabilis]KAK5150445.1 hypothetical protein LTS14_010135 [Recurvomyces mirabilis]